MSRPNSSSSNSSKTAAAAGTLHHRHTHVPVTALARHGRYTFAGEGAYLRVLSTTAKGQRSRGSASAAAVVGACRVFGAGQAVHGIRILSGRRRGEEDEEEGVVVVIVWGGAVVRILRVVFWDEGGEKKEGVGAVDAADHDGPRKGAEVRFELGEEIALADWILDVHAWEGEEERVWNVPVVTAHNALVVLRCEMVHRRFNVQVTQLVSPSRCILYAAHVQWISDQLILIAAGTAFGEILVWSANPSEQTVNATLHHILTGHEGSIFGVRISQPLKLPGTTADVRILASCSDDRSIRIWQIDLEHALSRSTPSEGVLDVLTDRDTGFGANHSEVEEAKKQCLALAFGHASRIWTVDYILPNEGNPDPDHILSIISTGEDATSQIWHLRKNTKAAHKASPDEFSLVLENSSTAQYHSGKNIWASCLDKSQTHKDRVDISTGAADGSIVEYTFPTHSNLDQWTITNVFESLKASIEEDVVGTRQELAPHNGWIDDNFRSYAFIDEHHLLVQTIKGKTLILNLKDISSTSAIDPTNTGHAHWEQADSLDDLKGYSVAVGLPSHKTAFFGSKTGTVYGYSLSSRKMVPVFKLPNKVTTIFASAYSSINRIYLTTTALSTNEAVINVLSSTLDSKFQVQHRLRLSLPLNFVLTSVAVPPLHEDNVVIFLGGRNGSILAYKVTNQSGDGVDSNSHIVPATSLTPRVHGNETVSSLLWVPNTQPVDSSLYAGWLLSTGRDGSCVMNEINTATSTLSMVHKLQLAPGFNAEGSYINPRTGSVLLYGFKNKTFVLFDLYNEQDILSVHCGGAHRVWDFLPLPQGYDEDNAGGGIFAWTKASELQIFTQKQPSHTRLKGGGHGREIKGVAVSPVLSQLSEYTQLIATGAEDTDIRIFAYLENDMVVDQSSLRSLRTLRQHRTGIQHLQWSEDGRYLFSSGGYEEFFVWRVRSLPGFGIGVVCVAICPLVSEVPELRITSFDARMLQSDGELLVSMVFSDSTMRVYQYSSQLSNPQKQFRLLGTGFYNGSCLTQTLIRPTDAHHVSTDSTFLTASTDGHIALWDAALPKLIPQSRNKVHQNSIKVMCSHNLGSQTQLVLTAGDDNAIGLSLIRHLTKSQEASAVATVSTLLIPHAHAAAITAVAFSPSVKAKVTDGNDKDKGEYGIWELRAVTSGNDQRVKVWTITVDLDADGVEGIDVQRCSNVPTGVADVSDLGLLGDGSKVLVVGVGMEVWEMR